MLFRSVLEEFATAFVSLTMSVASLDGEGGMKPTRITLRSFTLHSAASFALFFISIWVSSQKHHRCTSVFALAWRSCSSAHLLAVVFSTGVLDARSRCKVERSSTVGGDLPWRGSGEECPGLAEFIIDEGREELAMSGSRGRGSNGDWGGTHKVSDSVLCLVRPPFIPEPFLILPDSFIRRHVLLTYPFVIAIRVSLPLDQVLSGFLPPVVAYIQNFLDFVFLLIGDEVRGGHS